jgi:hypothetical protein
VLLLNHTPDRTGRIPAADAARTREFGDEIRRRFGCPLAAMSVPGEVLEMPLPPGANADHVILMEDIRQGERVREYALEGLVGGQWRELRRGTAIGHKRIEAFSPVAADALSLRCLTVSGPPRIRRFAAFATGSPAPRGLDVPPLVWAADVAGTWRQSRPAERLFRFDLTPFCREAGLYRMRFSAADGVSDPGFRDLVLRVGGVPVSDAIERAHESDSLLLNITGVDTGIVLETRLSALSGAAMVWRTYE